MQARVLTGSKQQIAETVIQIDGEVKEAIVFIAEPSDMKNALLPDDIFSEMEPFTVQAGGADYSRQSLYTRAEGE